MTYTNDNIDGLEFSTGGSLYKISNVRPDEEVCTLTQIDGKDDWSDDNYHLDDIIGPLNDGEYKVVNTINNSYSII